MEYLEPLLAEATKYLKEYGKGARFYSLTFTTTSKNGKEIKTIDTSWHYLPVEEVKA